MRCTKIVGRFGSHSEAIALCHRLGWENAYCVAPKYNPILKTGRRDWIVASTN